MAVGCVERVLRAAPKLLSSAQEFLVKAIKSSERVNPISLRTKQVLPHWASRVQGFALAYAGLGGYDPSAMRARQPLNSLRLAERKLNDDHREDRSIG
jgi:hypothetical protein